MNLVEAALLDQERRILEATPRQLQGGGNRSCRVCGYRVRADNKLRVCSRTRECRAEYQRLQQRTAR